MIARMRLKLDPGVGMGQWGYGNSMIRYVRRRGAETLGGEGVKNDRH